MNSQTLHPASIRHLFATLIQHRALIGRLVVREFEARFRGQIFGVVWSIVTPLLNAIVFTYVFSVVFQARWPSGSADLGTAGYALVFLAGMAVHSIFAEASGRAPLLIVSNSSYATKVVFPLEILPVVVLVTALINSAITLVLVLLGNLILNGSLHATALLLPVVLLPFFISVLALTYLFTAIGTFVRDIGQVLGLVVSISLFLTPIFYPLSLVPEKIRWFVSANPLTFAIEQARAVLLYGVLPDFVQLAIFLAASLLLLASTFWVFQRLRPGFADVL